jgi:hypothetical protein
LGGDGPARATAAAKRTTFPQLLTNEMRPLFNY